MTYPKRARNANTTKAWTYWNRCQVNSAIAKSWYKMSSITCWIRILQVTEELLCFRHMHYTCYKFTKPVTKTSKISAEILVCHCHSFRTFSSPKLWETRDGETTPEPDGTKISDETDIVCKIHCHGKTDNCGNHERSDTSEDTNPGWVIFHYVICPAGMTADYTKKTWPFSKYTILSLFGISHILYHIIQNKYCVVILL